MVTKVSPYIASPIYFVKQFQVCIVPQSLNDVHVPFVEKKDKVNSVVQHLTTGFIQDVSKIFKSIYQEIQRIKESLNNALTARLCVYISFFVNFCQRFTFRFNSEVLTRHDPVTYCN